MAVNTPWPHVSTTVYSIVLLTVVLPLGKTKEGVKELSKVTDDSKAKGNRKKEVNEDSGSDYGDNWSGDEWNDAQV